ncbi:translation initiation factor IF-2 [Candidatus Omnitrophota bacterium]
MPKQLGLTSKELLAKLKQLNVKVKGHMSALDEETTQIICAELKPEVKPKPAAGSKTAPEKKKGSKTEEAVEEKQVKALRLKIPLTVKELAAKLEVKSNDLIKQLMKMNILATINQLLDQEAVKKVSGELGFEVEREPDLEDQLLDLHQKKDAPKDLLSRAPVVTLMGHVDHGKTSLLDLIRETRVADREAGGITQHIGAYVVPVKGKKITFLDTPGHEAFTSMRARGANATDIVILVVAADDGIMPQTIEAIDHARAAEVPIVVAINKCDLPNINLAKVKAQLAQHDLVSEDMGGKTITVGVSAKTGQGIKELLEMILLEAEMLELKANPSRLAAGVVVESKLSRGTGPTATVLIQHGTLSLADVLICGNFYARIKSMRNDQGQQLNQAGPAEAVEISGLSGVPEAGERFYVVEDEKRARDFSLRRLEEKRLKGAQRAAHISLDDLYQQIQEGKIKELNIIIKSDVQGSVQALLQALQKLGSKDVTIKCIHTGVGNVNVSDVMLAAASNAIVMGFHVSVEARARELSEKEQVDIRVYNIIYEATADIKSALEGMLEPHLKETVFGRAQVKQMFKVTKVGNVAGCIVLNLGPWP